MFLRGKLRHSVRDTKIHVAFGLLLAVIACLPARLFFFQNHPSYSHSLVHLGMGMLADIDYLLNFLVLPLAIGFVIFRYGKKKRLLHFSSVAFLHLLYGPVHCT